MIFLTSNSGVLTYASYSTEAPLYFETGLLSLVYFIGDEES